MARREVLVQLDDEMVAALDQIAKRLGMNRSALIRRAVESVIQADAWAEADKRLVEGYRRHPEDPAFTEALGKLAAETVPEW